MLKENVKYFYVVKIFSVTCSQLFGVNGVICLCVICTFTYKLTFIPVFPFSEIIVVHMNLQVQTSWKMLT